MTLKLSDDLRQAVQEHGDRPITLVDAETNTTYVLMRAEQFDKLCMVLREDFDPREAYPFVDRVMQEDDANDPALASYQDLPEQAS
jgi:hypothetical protein